MLFSGLFYVFIIISILETGYVNANKKLGKIVGGTTTTISQAPFIVQLFSSQGVFCGGALIDPDRVITAAHCVDGKSIADVQVRGGTTALNSGGVTRSVAMITIAKRFNSRNMNMDIAMLKLTSPLMGDNIKTIALSTGGTKIGSNVRIWGWGIDETGSQSDVLKYTDVKVIKKARCKRYYPTTRNNFCAFTSGKDACFGDSGGPVTYNNQLIGLVSYGKGCGVLPGVYTSIRALKNFISKTRK